MKRRILLVEDDLKLAELIKEYLVREGFDLDGAGSGESALKSIQETRYDGFILDIGLPGMNGFELCRHIRAQSTSPIIVLTARGSEEDEIHGLEEGADDYLPKPFQPKRLLARLKALFRRTKSQLDSVITIGPLTVDRNARTATFESRDLKLTTSEFELLEFLSRHAGQVLSRSKLYLALRGYRYDGLDRSIDILIGRLRKKLGDTARPSRIIKSIHGTGYQLAELT